MFNPKFQFDREEMAQLGILYLCTLTLLGTCAMSLLSQYPHDSYGKIICNNIIRINLILFEWRLKAVHFSRCEGHIYQ